MLKYEVGDKVRIRADLKDGETYGADGFTGRMKKYCGKIAVIKDVKFKKKVLSWKPVYILDIDDGLWNWTGEMLEPARLARFYEDGKVVKTAKAHRKPDEPHNFKIGAKYAFDRLIEDKADEPEPPKLWNAKVICTKSGALWWTVGKVYEIVNGVIHDDDGDARDDIKPSGNIIVLETTTLATFQKVTAEQPPQPPQPLQYYTGKVFCVEAVHGSCWTAGKMYQVTEGRVYNGRGRGEWFSYVTDVEYLNSHSDAKFIEVKE